VLRLVVLHLCIDLGSLMRNDSGITNYLVLCRELVYRNLRLARWSSVLSRLLLSRLLHLLLWDLSAILGNWRCWLLPLRLSRLLGLLLIWFLVLLLTLLQRLLLTWLSVLLSRHRYSLRNLKVRLLVLPMLLNAQVCVDLGHLFDIIGTDRLSRWTWRIEMRPNFHRHFVHVRNLV
jgi:hypothetical protein